MFGFMAMLANLAAPFMKYAINTGERTREAKAQRHFAEREKVRQEEENEQLQGDYNNERSRLANQMYNQSMQQQMTLARSGGTAASQAASQNQALNLAPSTAVNSQLGATEGALGYAGMLGQNRLNQGTLGLSKQQFDWQQGEHLLDRKKQELNELYGAWGGGMSAMGSMGGGGGGGDMGSAAGAASQLGGMVSDERTKNFNRGVGRQWPAGSSSLVSDERVKQAAQDLVEAQQDYNDRTGQPAYGQRNQVTLEPQRIEARIPQASEMAPLYPEDRDQVNLAPQYILDENYRAEDHPPGYNPFADADAGYGHLRIFDKDYIPSSPPRGGAWDRTPWAMGHGPRGYAAGPSAAPQSQRPEPGWTQADIDFYKPGQKPSYTPTLPAGPAPVFAQHSPGPTNDVSKPWTPGKNLVPSQKDPWGDSLPPYEWKYPGQIQKAADKLPGDHPYFTNPGEGTNPPLRDTTKGYPTQAGLVDANGDFVPAYRHIPAWERQQMAEEQGLYSAKLSGRRKAGYDSGLPDPDSLGNWERGERLAGRNPRGFGYQPPQEHNQGRVLKSFFGHPIIRSDEGSGYTPEQWQRERNRRDRGLYGGRPAPFGQRVRDFWGKDKTFLNPDGTPMNDRERRERFFGNYEGSLGRQRAPWIDTSAPVPGGSFDTAPLIFRPTENSPGYFKDTDGRIKSVNDETTWADYQPQKPAQPATTMDETKSYLDLLKPPVQEAPPDPNKGIMDEKAKGLENKMENAPNPETPYDEVPDVPDGAIDKSGFFRVRRPISEQAASFRSLRSVGAPPQGALEERPFSTSPDISPGMNPGNMVDPNESVVTVQGTKRKPSPEPEPEEEPKKKEPSPEELQLIGMRKQMLASAKADEEAAQAEADFKAGRNISATERLKRMRAQQQPRYVFNSLRSDEDTKNKSGAGGAAETFRQTPGYAYTYKDEFLGQPGTKPGPQYGIMAQDLERTPVGRTVVGEDESGMKHVDADRLTMVNSAAIHELLTRLDKLEGRKKRGLPRASS